MDLAEKPAICVPLTGRTKDEILKELQLILPKKPDLIEWRADFFSNLNNIEYVLSIVEEIKQQSNLPLLFTIRSKEEGGQEVTLSEEGIVTLLNEVCQNSAVDYIDYEVSRKKENVQKVAEFAKNAQKKLILSYHNFNETPDSSKLMKKFVMMELFGAQIAKIAVMPKAKEDVLRLLHLTSKAERLLDIPIITMSMGELGSLSRMIGWAYGSLITFAVGAERSAPGQIPIEKLRDVIELTKENIDDWK